MKTSLLVIFMILMVSCQKNEPRRPIAPRPSTTIFKEAIEESKKINAQEEAYILNYIKNDSLNTYMRSPNGFWYSYNTKVDDSLATPQKGDEVELSYDLRQLNDSILYSKEELGLKKYSVDKEDFISGLQKGIKLMKTGETITFVIPSHNAFGVTGDGNKIQMNQTIKSTVTLIKINKKEDEDI